MADLSAQYGPNAANAIFCSWMAEGNILGYTSGSSDSWHKWFPFLMTRACCEACANLKGAFLVAVIFLILCTTITVIFAKEVPLSEEQIANLKAESEGKGPFLPFLEGLRTCLSECLPCFASPVLPGFLGFRLSFTTQTGWAEKYTMEIQRERKLRSMHTTKALGKGHLVCCSTQSLLVEPLCRKIGARLVWPVSNFMVFAAMAATGIISTWSLNTYHGSIQQAITADKDVLITALFLFAALGVPLAVLYSVPFAVATQLAAGQGGSQGLCTGVLNIAVVVPQVIVAHGASPWDALFKKGNIPAFAVASAVTFICGFLSLFILPKISRSQFQATAIGGGH